MAERFEHHCVVCGRGVGEPNGENLDERGRPIPTGFRSSHALRCLACDVKEVAKRKEYHRKYHLVRNGAISELIARHQKEYDRLMVEKNEEIEAEMERERVAVNRAAAKRAVGVKNR